MWICLPFAFLSIVHKDCQPDELMVRARRKGDIERTFPDAKVQRTPGNDYLFRAVLPRKQVAEVIAAHLACIEYQNFKNTVGSNDLHHAYNRVWGVMADLQEVPPYSRTPRRSAKQGGSL